MLEFLKNTAIKYGAGTSVGQGYIKSYLKERIETNFAEATVELDNIKKTIRADKNLAKELTATLKSVETKTAQLLSFATADEQLDVFSRIIGAKVGEFDSLDAFKDSLKQSPAINKMKEFALKLVSADIYEGLSAVIKKAGDIKRLTKKDQAEVVRILKSDEIAKNLQKIDLKKALNGFKVNGKAFCKEMKLDTDDTQDLETIFDELLREHLEDFQGIKTEFENHLPAVLKKLLEHVESECPHLAIEDSPKAITNSKTAPKSAAKTAPKSAPKKAAPKRKVEEVVEEEENSSDLSESSEVEVKKAPTKKKGPGRK